MMQTPAFACFLPPSMYLSMYERLRYDMRALIDRCALCA